MSSPPPWQQGQAACKPFEHDCRHHSSVSRMGLNTCWFSLDDLIRSEEQNGLLSLLLLSSKLNCAKERAFHPPETMANLPLLHLKMEYTPLTLVDQIIYVMELN